VLHHVLARSHGCVAHCHNSVHHETAVESRVEFRTLFLCYICNLYTISPIRLSKEFTLLKSVDYKNDRILRSIDILVIDTILCRSF
jgi:hypothetical protein